MIGAMSLVNVTVDADSSAGLSAATNRSEMNARPIITAMLLRKSLFMSHPLFRSSPFVVKSRTHPRRQSTVANHQTTELKTYRSVSHCEYKPEANEKTTLKLEKSIGAIPLHPCRR